MLHQDYSHIKLKCPICHKIISYNGEHMSCENHHIFHSKNGVFKLLTPKNASYLEKYLSKFEAYRNPVPLETHGFDVNQLPFANFDRHIWKLREIDLELITKLLKDNEALTILDYGAWNGWLSHNLSKLGHHAVAIDYFTAPYDGLQTLQFYDHKFMAIQMWLEDLSAFNSKFDMIVVNRCFQHFPTIETQLEDLKNLLNSNGILLITGLNKTNAPNKAKIELEQNDNTFKKRFDSSLYINSFKGYIDKSDIQFLKHKGFQIKNYNNPILYSKSLLSKIGISQIDYLYGIYTKRYQQLQK